jgi:hypothetical protein
VTGYPEETVFLPNKRRYKKTEVSIDRARIIRADLIIGRLSFSISILALSIFRSRDFSTVITVSDNHYSYLRLP